LVPGLSQSNLGEEQFGQPKMQFGVSLRMRKIGWLVVGLILALIIGAIAFHFWNQIISFLAAAVVFGIFAIAVFAGGGFSDDEDEEDEDEDDEEDDND
jgi:fatty acid desaturase